MPWHWPFPTAASLLSSCGGPFPQSGSARAAGAARLWRGGAGCAPPPASSASPVGCPRVPAQRGSAWKPPPFSSPQRPSPGHWRASRQCVSTLAGATEERPPTCLRCPRRHWEQSAQRARSPAPGHWRASRQCVPTRVGATEERPPTCLRCPRRHWEQSAQRARLPAPGLWRASRQYVPTRVGATEQRPGTRLRCPRRRWEGGRSPVPQDPSDHGRCLQR